MNNNFSNRRRNYYIKKEFQRNFILKFCGLVAAGAVMSGLIVYAMSLATVTTTFENLRLTIKSTAAFILPALILSSIVVVVLVGVATIFITLFTSHKIAGALYAIEKHVDEVASGNLNVEFRLRSGDQLKPLAVGLDVMVRNLRTNVRGIKDAATDLENAIGRKGAHMPDDVRNKLEQLKSRIGTFSA